MAFLGYLGLAFVGGLVLNVMPCVLPVLTLKAFTLVEHAQADRSVQRRQGVGYALGTMSALGVLGGVVVALRSAGRLLGWGMQFQQPLFVAAVITIVFAFALNALGVFEIVVGMDDKERGSGILGSVANGWFAALMATPCSAPFLGPASAFAMGSDVPGWQTILIFCVIGLGLAFPFAALAFVPAIGRVLPKPGKWMETFKQIMGFSLLGTAVWLFGVLLRQVTPESGMRFLAFLLVVAVSLWGWQRFGGLDASTLRRLLTRTSVVLAVVAGGFALVRFERAAAASSEGGRADDAVVKDGHIAWVGYDAKRVTSEGQRNRPVFLDFTADWCASCKANERLFLETETVRTALQRTDILPMRADMTNENEELEDFVKKLGRNGIPIYVVLFPDGSRDLLPVTITAEMVQERLEEAAKRYPKSAYLPARTASR